MSQIVSETNWNPPKAFSIRKEMEGKTDSYRTDITIRELFENRHRIDFSPQEYQRHFRADVIWQSKFIMSIFDPYILIPEMAFRYTEKDGGLKVEVMDGCQRGNSIMNFIDGSTKLPTAVMNCDTSTIECFCLGDEVYNLLGMSFTDIKERYPDVADWFFKRSLWSQVYTNVTDERAAHIFRNVLNNANELTSQEKRNATRSAFAAFCRETGRTNPHRIFTREKCDNKCKYIDTEASKMKPDETIAELVVLLSNSQSLSCNKTAVDELYNNTKFVSTFHMADKVKGLLNKAMAGIDKNPKTRKSLHPKVLRNYLYMIHLFEQRKFKIDTGRFLRLFLTEHYYLQENVTKEDLKTSKDTGKVTSYNKSWGGNGTKDNTKCIEMLMKRIFQKATYGKDYWSVDPSRVFDRKMIEAKLLAQNNICALCNEELGDNPVGDHIYEYSKGGKTNWDNLQVTHLSCNLEKGKTSEKKKRKTSEKKKILISA